MMMTTMTTTKTDLYELQQRHRKERDLLYLREERIHIFIVCCFPFDAFLYCKIKTFFTMTLINSNLAALKYALNSHSKTTPWELSPFGLQQTLCFHT